MKKGLKLFVSRAMLMVLMCTIILPLFPALEVKAAVVEDPATNAALADNNKRTVVEIWQVLDSQSKINLKDANGDKVTRWNASPFDVQNKWSDDVLDVSTEKSACGNIAYWLSKELWVDGDAFLESNLDIDGYSTIREALDDSWFFGGFSASIKESTSSQKYIVMYTFNKNAGTWYTYIIGAVRRSNKDQDGIGIYIVESTYMYNNICVGDLTYNNCSYFFGGRYGFDYDAYALVIAEVMDSINNTIRDDIKRPSSISSSKLEEYHYIDRLVQFGVYTTEGNSSDENKAWSGFMLRAVGTLSMFTKPSDAVLYHKYNPEWRGTSNRYKSYLEMWERGLNNCEYILFPADIGNKEGLYFGDANAFTSTVNKRFTFNQEEMMYAVDVSKDVLDFEHMYTSEWEYDRTNIHYVENDTLGMAIGMFLQGMCSADWTDSSGTTQYAKFTAALSEMETKLGSGTYHDIIAYYCKNLQTMVELYGLKNEQEWLSENTDGTLLADVDTKYQAVSTILGEAIRKSSSGGSIIGLMVDYAGDTYYIGTSIASTGGYDSIGGKKIKSFQDLWSGLNDYQKTVLSISYTEVCENRNFTSGVLLYVKTAGASMGYTKEMGAEFSANKGSTFIDGIQNVIQNKDPTIVDTFSLYNIARNCNTLGQYIVGMQLVGDNSSGTNDIYGMYDATLASLACKDYTVDGINSGWFPQYLPYKLPLFGDNTKYFSVLDSSGHIDYFVHFMYNVTYAFEVSAFSQGGEGNYDPATLYAYLINEGKTDVRAYDGTSIGDNAKVMLDGWLKGANLNSMNGSDKNLFGNDEFSQNMIRSIIELADLCEFLGVTDMARSGDWSDAIKAYLDIYYEFKPFFDKCRENPAIYAQAPVGESNIDEPLGMFFMIEDSKMSDQWCKGFSASALFVPMETNLYDANSIAYVTDSDFIADFYYKYAFYRKALYINTDNSAIVNEKVSGQKSGTRVATLRDLINYDRDIILTVDDNFYNAKDVGDIIGKLDYNAIRNGSETNTDNAWDSLKNWTSELFNLAPDQILKTGSVSYYSTTLASGVTKLGQDVTLKSRFADVYLLSQDQILGTDVIDDSNTQSGVFDSYEYSVKVPYGVVSAIYRDTKLYNECLRAIASDNAIFKSSKGICSVPGSNSSDWRAVYNYCMLANLEDQMKNDAASSLDLNAPIFCDIFGNIVTESGLVIIPAAANATLCGKAWTPCTVGWSEYYNNGNRLCTGEFSDEVYSWLTGMEYDSSGAQTTTVQYIDHYDADGNPVYSSTEITTTNTTITNSSGVIEKNNGGGYFVIDRDGTLILRTSGLAGKSASAIVQWENLNKNSTVVKELFYNDAYYNKCNEGKIYSKTLVNLVVETMRGAPIEYIDYEYEGLAGNTDISKFGVYMAYKLEELTNALISGTNGNALGGNSAVTMPNLAFVSGIEYIMLYVFKIVFAIMLVGLAVSLYLDAVKNHLGIKSVGKFLVTCMMTIVALTLVPNLISWSYYKANKELLTEESGYIMMLNYVKAFDGAEIGITSIETPETTTKLYLKMDDISINWWDIIGEVLFNNTYKTVTELYSSQLSDNPMAMQESVQMKGDGLYVDVQDVFDSTNIIYYPNQKILQNVAYSNASKAGSSAQLDSTVVSFNMPYYVFLDKLVAAINEYNIQMSTEAYSYRVGSNGHIMTYDIISPYLTSNEFLDEGFDILGLNEILQTGVNMTSYTEGMFSGEYSWDDSAQAYVDSGSIGQMKKSRWYPSGTTTDDLTQQKINEVYDYARNWIARNRDVLGKVPDEVFLKVFCMELALKYNKVFGIHTTNSIEIMNIDTRDLARLMIADRASVYKYYSYGFARFTYEQSGTIGVIFVAIYFVILWITSMIKPILMIVILALLIINVLGRKVLFRKESRCIEGYLIGCACLVLCNYAYALMLKATLAVSSFGFGTVAAMALAIFVQLLYVVGLIFICAIEVKDWKNSGFHEFAAIGASITSGLTHAKNVVVDKMISKNNSAYRESSNSRKYSSGDYDASSVNDMLDRDAQREENAMNVI